MSAETDMPGGQGAVRMSAGAPPAPDPTPTVSHEQQTASHPAGSSLPDGGVPIQERPEALVGGAFAGGLLAALILKRLGR
jgi:hypothetical protein